MRKLLSAMSAAALAATMAITGVIPLNAAPIAAPTIKPDTVIKVQSGGMDSPRMGAIYGDSPIYRERRAWRGDGNWRRGDRDWRPRHYRGGPRYGWYNGHRGYRHWRRGYREHNGWWFPAGAFVAGAIIGSTINSGPRYYRGESSAHVRWCYNRYRSYREWDNTFQPYHGPRQQCYSPYS